MAAKRTGSVGVRGSSPLSSTPLARALSRQGFIQCALNPGFQWLQLARAWKLRWLSPGTCPERRGRLTAWRTTGREACGGHVLRRSLAESHPSGLGSAPQIGDLVQAAELVRVAHGVHAGDPAVLDDE